MSRHEGGCLCGKVRYRTTADPARVTICHCRFCQRATGSAYMVEPIFAKGDFTLLAGSPHVYEKLSEGSGKMVRVHFCADCGTKLWLSFERFPDVIGVYAGTFDDPCWFPLDPKTSKHIFVGVARHDTVLPKGLPTFVEHAMSNDGTPQEATVLDSHRQVREAHQ
jgi:hypothetical protein